MTTDTVKKHPFEILKERTDQALQRQADNAEQQALAAALQQETSASAAPPVTEHNSKPELRRGGDQARISLESDFYKGEQLGLFTTFPMHAGNEFPTLFTRLPIFMPMQRNAQKKLLDKNNALPFETPFGSGKRNGPNLTIADEDRLIAMLRLRQKRLLGQPSKLPIPVPEVYRSLQDKQDGEVWVHTLVCTVSQINDELGITDAGSNYKQTVESVKNLSAVVLEINTNKHERYFGKIERGSHFKLVDVQWTIFETDGIIVAQFSPLMVYWLEQELTYLDWEIRKQLKGDAVKAIHRFLSSQGNKDGYFEREIAKISPSVGLADKSQKRQKEYFADAIAQLRVLGWLEDGVIEGTGRKHPFKLSIVKARRRGKSLPKAN